MDVELRCLDVIIRVADISESDNEQPILLKYFLKAMGQQLDRRIHYELVQAFLSLFLKIHSETIMKSPELVKECEVLYSKLTTSQEELDDSMKKSLCVTNYLRNAVI